MNKTKQLISRIWRPLFERFNRQVEDACLRRDAYLDRVLSFEAAALLQELPSPNSPEARAYLQSQLDQLDRVPVNFSLSASTVEAINRACKERNVIRDCLMNRVIFLLVADANTYQRVLSVEMDKMIPEILESQGREAIYAPVWDGGLRAIAEIVNGDAFYALRSVIAHCREECATWIEPLHACRIIPEMFSKRPQGVLALNCYWADECIPGSAAKQRAIERLEELLGPVTERSDGA